MEPEKDRHTRDTFEKKTLMKSPSSETDSSISMTFDSTSDYGYKSGDINTPLLSHGLPLSDSNTQSKKSESNVTYDSGYVSEIFSTSSDLSSSEKIEASSKLKQPTYTNLKAKYLWSDVFTQDEDGDTILHLAIVEARSDIIFPLIRLAPHPNFLDLSNYLYQTLLHLATLTGKSNIVRRLVVVGATLDMQDHGGNTPLHIASRNGDLDCVQAILTPISQSEINDSACTYRLYPQSEEFSHLINRKNYDGQSCMHLAASGGFLKVMECLFNYDADIDDQDRKTGRSALHYAVENGNYDLVRILLSKCSADPKLKNYAGQSPYRLAKCLQNRNPANIRKNIVDLIATYVETSDSQSESSDNEIDDDFAEKVFQDLLENK